MKLTDKQIADALESVMALHQIGQDCILLIKAARYLLLAAEGPEGGPTNWNETRRKWMETVERLIDETN